MTNRAIEAQAELHHQYLLGLELMVATREGREVVGEWMFRLFRSQHEAKFLSSFEKLGLAADPHAIACAKYHVLSNAIGGVAVEYMPESPRKAWVRFRYPRWMYDGPVICGVPIEASRGFLRGWYAHNGVSLGNPRLGFVCVSEDMTGQFGLCGYFREADHDLAEEERLVFAPDERPPAFDPALQLTPPAQSWSEERLVKAKRNYALEYIRNGIRELAAVVGEERARELGRLAARLTGLQHYPRMARAVDAVDAGPADAARFLARMFVGMGDESEVTRNGDAYEVEQRGLRITRGLEGLERERLLDCWGELWRGAVSSHRQFLGVDLERRADSLCWRISESGDAD